MNLKPDQILKTARKRAALSQRELAKRAGTSQSVIARIESGVSDPSTNTLKNLVEAAGFDLDVELSIRPVADSHMLSEVNRILSLTPEERLREVANVERFIKSVKHVG